MAKTSSADGYATEGHGAAAPIPHPHDATADVRAPIGITLIVGDSARE